MARTWGWMTGWEGGFIRRMNAGTKYPAPAARYAPTAVGQDLWDVFGTDNNNPFSGTARTGEYYARIAPAGFGAATNFVGQWITRTNDWVFWHTPIRVGGWLVPGALAGADDYVFSRCTPVAFAPGAPGGADYLGIGIRTAVLPVTDFQVVVHHFSNVGALIAAGVLVDAVNVFTPPTGWIVATIAHEVAGVGPRNTYLYVNGVLRAGPWAAPVIQNDMPILPDNRFLAGKGADAGPILDLDDWGGAEGSVQADVPGNNNGVLRSQPISDVLTQWTPMGNADHYRNWDAEGQDFACAGCHYNDPTGVGQQEACTFAPLVLAAPAVEAARFVWAQYGAIHTVRGRLGAAAWPAALPAGTGAEVTVAPHCFGGANVAQWRGAQMAVTPTGGPVWTTPLFNTLQGRLDAAIAANGGVEEFYAMAMVNAAARTMPTPNPCPPAAGRRRWPGGVF